MIVDLNKKIVEFGIPPVGDTPAFIEAKERGLDTLTHGKRILKGGYSVLDDLIPLNSGIQNIYNSLNIELKKRERNVTVEYTVPSYEKHYWA